MKWNFIIKCNMQNAHFHEQLLCVKREKRMKCFKVFKKADTTMYHFLITWILQINQSCFVHPLWIINILKVNKKNNQQQ